MKMNKIALKDSILKKSCLILYYKLASAQLLKIYNFILRLNVQEVVTHYIVTYYTKWVTASCTDVSHIESNSYSSVRYSSVLVNDAKRAI